MILIIADDEKEEVGRRLFQYYKEHQIEAEYISAKEREILPCYSCGGCTYKTYGKCVVKDDTNEIVPLLLEADIIVYTSPIVWGGFSYSVKKIIDKMALTGDRFYKVKHKEFAKGSIGKVKKIVGIGIQKEKSEKEKKDFEFLVKEIATIICVKPLSIVVGEKQAAEEVILRAEEVIRL